MIIFKSYVFCIFLVTYMLNFVNMCFSSFDNEHTTTHDNASCVPKIVLQGVQDRKREKYGGRHQTRERGRRARSSEESNISFVQKTVDIIMIWEKMHTN